METKKRRRTNSPTKSASGVEPYWAAFAQRSDLKQYGDNALLLYALELKFRLDDIHTVAVDALTDSPNDKGCDLVFIDRDLRLAVVAQGYVSQKSRAVAAPANKAASLSQAATWLLSAPSSNVPVRLRSAAQELRQAIKDNEVDSVQLWYVHNLPQSENAQSELDQAARTFQSLAKVLSSEPIFISGTEIGRETLSEWYKGLTVPILVTDRFEVPTPGGFEVSANGWRAFVTAVPGQWLAETFKNHELTLFSANVRGYLGSRNVDANINNGIKTTAQKEPDNFWVYNNGVTFLVNNFDCDENGKLTVTGLSIVNGAQTTGALGSIRSHVSDNILVPARFVESQRHDIVMSIIKYNNSQNKVEAPDFRSNDEVQKRLVKKFDAIHDALYLGGRRGGSEDVIKRPANLLPSDTVAQALMAFHGSPGVAYNEKSRIWVSDNLYSKIFNERVTAEHIVLVYALLRSLEDRKKHLNSKAKVEQIKKDEQQQVDFFRNRGATILATAAIGACMETILDCPVPDLFRLSFASTISPKTAQKYWGPILEATAPLLMFLDPALRVGLKNATIVRESIEKFATLVAATQGANKVVYEQFRKRVTK